MVHRRSHNNPLLTASSHQFLCLPNELFPCEFTTRSLSAPVPHACCMHIFLLDLVSWITFGGEHKSWSSSLWNFSPVLRHFLPLRPEHFSVQYITHSAHGTFESTSVLLIQESSTLIPRLTKIIRSGITFVSRNVISRRFL